MEEHTGKEKVISLLRDAGVSPSIPRIDVFEYLLNHPIHPNVDMIFKALSPTHPTLSRTTVYNTLRLLAEKGLAQILHVEDGELRYDGMTEFHAHFKCSSCGKVFDLLGIAQPVCPNKQDFQIESTQVNFFGLCPLCKK